MRGTSVDGAVRPLRVVHVITSLTTGGAERQLEMLVRRSSSESVTIALYAGGPVADSMREAGERVEVLDLNGWHRLLAPLLLARRLRHYRPDVVHVHLLSAQLWGIPAARLARVPVVVSTEHSLMDDTIEGRPHTWWLRTLYRGLERLATHTVAVSATTAVRLRRWGIHDSRITVADNGIDFEALEFDVTARRRVRAELGVADDVHVIGAVGRLDPVKRMDRILRATAPALREGALLVVAGTGPLLGELVDVAATLGVTERVRWLGPRGDISAVLSAVDVLVSASADETFGMAVVEAVGSGLPVVYVEAPALDGLGEVPAQAVQVTPTADAAADERRLGEAVEDALADVHRWPVPTVLTERYGARAAADRVDDVYASLVSRARG
ncbi:MAG: glycosyltransferase [Lapillicoccus sp.]